MAEQDNIINFPELSEKKARDILQEIIKESSKVKFSTHALDRMIERGVSRTQVIKVLSGRGRFEEAPHRTPKGSWKMTIVGISAGHEISVTCALDYSEKTGNYAVVVTTYII